MTSSKVVLKLNTNCLDHIIKFYGLDTTALSECLHILREWIEKQPHFNKRDFSQNFLETTLISCKGSVERAKLRLDKYCTMRTMMPRFFDALDAKNDFPHMDPAIKVAILPQCTDDFYRIMILKVTSNNLSVSACLDFYKFGTICLEYLKANDYFNGMIVVVDYLDINITDVIPVLNPIDLGDAMKLYTDGYGLRIKGIHFLTPSKLIETVVSIFKSLLSSKIGGRLFVHSTLEGLHETISKDILPKDYGGKEKSFYSMCDDLVDILSTKDSIENLQEMTNAHTNECYRSKDEFNDKYIGTQGTFRSLAVD